MMDKAHLQGKRVIFKIDDASTAFIGAVSFVENDGLWIVAPDLAPQLLKGGPTLPPAVGGTIVIFVPTSRLRWLVTTQ